MDFLSGQRIFYTSKKYENVYLYFKNEYDITYDELFTIAAVIGFKNNKTGSVTEKGREFRSNYFKRNNKATIYSIVLNDKDLGKQIDKFEDSDYVVACKKRLEEYAEGGMDWITENLFPRKWDGIKLDSSYDEYLIDIMTYVYGKYNEVPF